MNFRLEHPRPMVGFLCCAVLLLAALLEYDNRVLDRAIVELRFCAQQGIRQVRAAPAFPSRLRFNNEDWTIIHKDPPRAFGVYRGLTLCKQRVVYVAPDEQERDTLLHEMLHVSFGCPKVCISPPSPTSSSASFATTSR